MHRNYRIGPITEWAPDKKEIFHYTKPNQKSRISCGYDFCVTAFAQMRPATGTTTIYQDLYSAGIVVVAIPKAEERRRQRLTIS